VPFEEKGFLDSDLLHSSARFTVVSRPINWHCFRLAADQSIDETAILPLSHIKSGSRFFKVPMSTEPPDEVEDIDEIGEVLPTKYTITSYGADYPVDGLVKRMEQGDIIVPSFNKEVEEGQKIIGFQRDFVWRKPQADKFIESLLLGLPVPGIFLVKEPNGKLLVLDGRQRLRTLAGFYKELFQKREFSLENVQKHWVDKTYKTLEVEDRRRIDDSIIHATIIKQDEPSNDQSSIYLIFGCLNSGGTFLQPQEIRVALYHGAFANLLDNLNKNHNWRALYGQKSARLKDLELILRFFALFERRGSYKKIFK